MSEFSFSDSAATNYDDLLVPIVFEPWAKAFIATRTDWAGKNVLDLAAGTGIVTRLLSPEVGTEGTIHAVDLNPDMLNIARTNCAEAKNVTFMEASAESLDLPDNSIDILTCQQGFQFFPDKPAATAEIQRVLRPGGSVLISTWCNIEQCDPFYVIIQALDSIGANDISTLLRTPFDFMPAPELKSIFEAAGFNGVSVEKITKTMTMQGGIEQAIKTVYGTPIAPMLKALPPEKQEALNQKLTELYTELTPDGKTYGNLNSNQLTAHK